MMACLKYLQKVFTMITETQDDTYFRRMKSSLGDKSRILDHLVEGTVLDFGAGGGDLSDAIRQLGYDVVAVDGSPAAVAKINVNYPEVNAVQAMGHELLDHFPEKSFDNIVCCSILHEVFSYGDDVNAPYSLESVFRMMTIFRKLLRDGGRLIIRDGVAPTDANDKTFIKFKNDDGMKFLKAYSEQAPFYADENIAGGICLDKVDEFVVEGSMRSVMEFLYTYTWGWNSLPRESQEVYGVFSLRDYSEMLSNHSFNTLSASEYVQQGYVDHLSKLVSIADEDGVDMPYPATNMLIVAEKKH